MKIRVDMDVCQNYGQCVFAAPDVFSMDDSGHLAYVSDPDDALLSLTAVITVGQRIVHIYRMTRGADQLPGASPVVPDLAGKGQSGR